MLRGVLLAIYLLLYGICQCQPFPVSGNLQLTSTHLPHLEDYLIQQPERMMYTINLNDLNRPQLDVFLRVSISGAGVSIQSEPQIIGNILTIEPGIPTLLTGNELAPLFNPNNLVALSESGAEIIIRIPLIAGINDDEEKLKQTASFISALPNQVQRG